MRLIGKMERATGRGNTGRISGVPASNNGREHMQRLSTAFRTALAAGALTVGFAGATAAQGVITTQRLSAALANELVGDAVANCAQKHYAVTAVVVDLDGVRQAMLRGDGAPVHTIDYAWRKAYSAASITLGRNEDSTMAVATRMLKQPPSPLPGTPPEHVTYAAGGVTIRAGGAAIAAIGVSGAPGGQFDDACARAALGKIQDRLK
jgi:uncharacterized protein GlcG (DUF336 family)